MITEKQIVASFKMTHDDLSEWYYSGKSNLDKAHFDAAHRQIWVDLDELLIARGFRPRPVPARDLAIELDALEVRVKKLEPLFFPEEV